jgi:hypothetical protein
MRLKPAAARIAYRSIFFTQPFADRMNRDAKCAIISFLLILAFMDVRKLVIALGLLILLAVGIVLYMQVDQPVDRRRSDPVMAAKVEVQHGPALRAMGVRSLGVDPKTSDVVVVFKGGGRLGRRVAGRLPGLASAEGCGELEVGISVGDTLTAWGDSSSPSFYSRLDCVIDEVVSRAAELRDPE